MSSGQGFFNKKVWRSIPCLVGGIYIALWTNSQPPHLAR